MEEKEDLPPKTTEVTKEITTDVRAETKTQTTTQVKTEVKQLSENELKEITKKISIREGLLPISWMVQEAGI